MPAAFAPWPSDLATRFPLTRAFGDAVCLVRPLGPADKDRLIEFFASHDPETIRQRYGYPIAQMTHSRAAQLVGVDQSRDLALGVFGAPHPAPAGHRGVPMPAEAVIHAVGRYCLLDDGRGAEAAFVTRETLRGRGIAGYLLDLLMAVARARGLRHLVAQVQRDNPAMLAVFAARGGTRRSIPDTDGVEIEISLVPPPARPRPGPRRR